jgi:hypothetical protein
MAEFAIAVPVLLMILLGVFDLGRGVYMYNGVAEAAREIARATSVHPGTAAGPSVETLDVVAIQKALVPGMVTPSWPSDFSCSDVGDSPTSRHDSPCKSGEYVTVTVKAPYKPIAFLGLVGPFQLQSSSSIAVP